MKRIIGYLLMASIFPLVFGLIGYKASNLTVSTGIIIGLVVDCVAIMFGISLSMIEKKDKNK